MENEYGCSLFADVIYDLSLRYRWINQETVQFVDFMPKACGRRGVDVLPSIVECFLDKFLQPPKHQIPTSEEYENVASILRIIFDNAVTNPLESAWLPSLVDSDATQNSFLNAIIRQSQWPIDLSPTLIRRTIVESLHQMLEDPDGDMLKRLIQNADTYCLRLTRGYSYGNSSYNLLELASKAEDSDIRYCSKNRVKLLIGTPELHRFLRLLKLDFDEICVNPSLIPFIADSGDPTENYIGRYSIRHGYRPLLEDIFRDLRRSEFDINDCFDKDTFYCVSELLDGQIVYETAQQAQKEFIINLCDGTYSKASEDEIDLLTPRISRTCGSYSHFDDKVKLLSIIRKANTAFTLQNTPGSWPEGGKTWLVPGVDFEIDRDTY
jgi:hypothetical protein